MTRELLAFACRAFPPDHRARRSDEVVDTALLAADGSVWRTAREAFSLVVAGMGQRLRAESVRSPGDGVALLAGVLAVVNLGVALAGIADDVHAPPPQFVILGNLFARSPYVVDWWWIGFAVAAAGIVLGLVLGDRRLALGAALVNLSLVGYDAIFLAGEGRGHLEVFTYLQTFGFPFGWHWLAPAAVLTLATAAAPYRRFPLSRLPLALVAALLLVVLSREAWGGFFVLVWPLGVIVVLAMAFGALAPRLAVVAVGALLAAVPSVVAYLTRPDAVTMYDHHHHHDPFVIAGIAAGVALGVVLPLAQLTRRRLA